MVGSLHAVAALSQPGPGASPVRAERRVALLVDGLRYRATKS
ncbi:hypothetical protein [Phytoactinopolyspora endophytica]|nr:hypothetical protein [Phytoactinopolyspora endophytica]